jgi:hypothetical protein
MEVAMAALLEFDARGVSSVTGRWYTPLIPARSMTPDGSQRQRPTLSLRWKLGPDGRPASKWAPEPKVFGKV